jgi:hypothetical protein
MAELYEVLRFDQQQLREARDRLTRGVLRAAKGTIAEATKGMERELEALTRSAVKGRLWRAWASEVYPRGTKLARDPVGEVFVKGGARSQGAMAFFTQPGRIRGKEGFFLAIPTPAAGPQGRSRNLTPGEWERRTGARLRFVYRRNGPSLLVLDEGVLSGKRQVARLNTARRREAGRGNATIVVFILVPMVSFANRFSVDPVVRKWVGKLPDDFAARVAALR